MISKGVQDFVSFTDLLKSFYGSGVSEDEFGQKLFESFCDAEFEWGDSTLRKWLRGERSVYARGAKKLLATKNPKKFSRWIQQSSVDDETLKKVLKSCKTFVTERPYRFPPKEAEGILKLYQLETVGQFVTEIFVNILSKEDPVVPEINKEPRNDSSQVNTVVADESDCEQAANGTEDLSAKPKNSLTEVSTESNAASKTDSKTPKQSRSANRKGYLLKYKKIASGTVIVLLMALVTVFVVNKLTEEHNAPRIANNNTLPVIVASENAVPDFLVARDFYVYRVFDETLNSLTTALDEQIRVSGATNVDTARVYAALGYTQLGMGDYTSAVENLSAAISIISEQGVLYGEELGRLYYNRCLAYMALYKTDEAVADHNKAAAIVNTDIANPNISDYRAGIYLTIGEILTARGEIYDALKSMDVAIKLKAEYDPANQTQDISPVVVPYMELSSDASSYNFYFGDAELAAILCNRGLLYCVFDEPDKAQRDANIALGILNALTEQEQQDVWPLYYGLLHFLAYTEGDMPHALDYAAEAIARAEAGSGRNPFYKGFLYENQGRALDVSSRYEEALESHLTAYKIFLALNNERKINHNEQLMRSIMGEHFPDIDFDEWLTEQME